MAYLPIGLYNPEKLDLQPTDGIKALAEIQSEQTGKQTMNSVITECLHYKTSSAISILLTLLVLLL